MAEASAHKLSYVVETTRGTTPATPVMQRLPDTRTSIALTKDTLETERLTGDRFPAEPRSGAEGVSGDIPADISFSAYDHFIESALQGEFVENTPGDDTALAGDTRKSFSILREFSDLTGGKPFLLYSGCEVATWNLEAAANGIAKSTFSMFGQAMTAELTAPTGATYTPAIDTVPFDTFSGSLEIDTVEECIVTDYSLTINNGHAPKYTVGCQGTGDPSVTQSVVEGSITVYFENTTLYEKFLDEESFSLKLTLQDLDGNQLIVFLPNLKMGSGTQPDVSEDGAITMPINFTAHKDDTLGSHVSVQRIEA